MTGLTHVERILFLQEFMLLDLFKQESYDEIIKILNYGF